MQIATLIQRAAQRSPTRIATISDAHQRTWAELQQRIASLAGALQSAGLKPGDRVAVLALNSDRYYEAFFAIPWANGVLVPMNTRWSAEENRYAAKDSSPSVLFVDDTFAELGLDLQSSCPSLHTLVYMGNKATPSGMLAYEAFLAGSNPAPLGDNHGSDLAGIFYTGGTTGFPKGVMLSHTALIQSATSTVIDHSIIAEHVVYLHAAPMFHLADVAMTVANTLKPASHCFLNAFDPAKMLDVIAKNQVTSIGLVPTMIQMLFDHPHFKEVNLNSLARLSYGGSPIPPALIERITSELPSVQLHQAYGQTEMAPMVTCLRHEDHLNERRSSVGQAILGVDIKIVDPELNTLAEGEIGQIAARGANAMQGYWNKPEQTTETLVDGWVLTGDAGYLDQDAYLHLVDRVKDMIISGGENVYSVEVENALSRHPAVQLSAVIGIPDENWGEAVHAIVVLKPNTAASEQELIDHCKTLIAGYKCPKSITLRNEPMPLSGAGKILKNVLREPYWQGKTRAIN